MFKSLLCRYSTRSQISLRYASAEGKHIGEKELSFLGPKIETKINPSIKNVKTRLVSCIL